MFETTYKQENISDVTLAKLRIEEARIEAEEKLNACSERGSVAASRRSRMKSLHASTSSSTTTRAGRSEFGTDAGFRKTSNFKTLKIKQAESKSSLSSHLSKPPVEAFGKNERSRRFKTFLIAFLFQKVLRVRLAKLCRLSTLTSVAHNYLERQDRNEFINLASQINYNGSKIAFVFYENQIRKLWKNRLSGKDA